MEELFNKQQRHEIYKHAKDLLLHSKAAFMCEAIEDSIKELFPNIYGKYCIKLATYSKTIQYFPEMLDIKPEDVKLGDSWWPYPQPGNKIRLEMFDLIIERTK